MNKYINTLFLSIFLLGIMGSVFADNQGPNNPEIAINRSPEGEYITDWTSPTNIISPGAPYTEAYPVFSNNGTTFYLIGKNYGFNIPLDARITGIEVTINRKSTGGATALRDKVVSLMKDGSITSDNKALTTIDWDSNFNTKTYGGQDDLWGTAWTPDNINSSNFGIALQAINPTANDYGDRHGHVDYMQIEVYYTLPDTTAPLITQVTPVGYYAGLSYGYYTNDSTPNYTFNSTEAGTITYAGDCNSVTTSAVAGDNTITFKELADGTYNDCTLTVTDDFENISNTLEVPSFVVDTEAPTVNVGSDIVINSIDELPVILYGEAGYSYGYNSDRWSSQNEVTLVNTSLLHGCYVCDPQIPGPQITAVSEDGNYVITLRVTDMAGNVGSDTLNLFYDVDAPTDYGVSFDQKHVDATNKNAISFTFANAELDTTYNFSIDDENADTAPITGTGTINNVNQQIIGIDLSALSDGELTLQATLTDSSSKLGPVATDTITKDLVGPVTTLAAITTTDNLPYPEGNPTNQNIKITLSCTDAVSGCDTNQIWYGLFKDSDTEINWIQYTEPVIISDRNYTEIWYISFDLFGNLEMGENSDGYNAFKFHLDNNAPIITLLGDSTLIVNRGHPYVEAGATAFDDVDGNLDTNIVVVDSVNTSVAGTYYVTYDVNDTAGNAAIQVIRTVRVVGQPSIGGGGGGTVINSLQPVTPTPEDTNSITTDTNTPVIENTPTTDNNTSTNELTIPTTTSTTPTTAGATGFLGLPAGAASTSALVVLGLLVLGVLGYFLFFYKK